jgi:hypothetical protein
VQYRVDSHATAEQSSADHIWSGHGGSVTNVSDCWLVVVVGKRKAAGMMAIPRGRESGRECVGARSSYCRFPRLAACLPPALHCHCAGTALELAARVLTRVPIDKPVPSNFLQMRRAIAMTLHPKHMKLILLCETSLVG